MPQRSGVFESDWKTPRRLPAKGGGEMRPEQGTVRINGGTMEKTWQATGTNWQSNEWGRRGSQCKKMGRQQEEKEWIAWSQAHRSQRKRAEETRLKSHTSRGGTAWRLGSSTVSRQFDKAVFALETTDEREGPTGKKDLVSTPETPNSNRSPEGKCQP